MSRDLVIIPGSLGCLLGWGCHFSRRKWLIAPWTAPLLQFILYLRGDSSTLECYHKGGTWKLEAGLTPFLLSSKMCKQCWVCCSHTENSVVNSLMALPHSQTLLQACTASSPIGTHQVPDETSPHFLSAGTPPSPRESSNIHPPVTDSITFLLTQDHFSNGLSSPYSLKAAVTLFWHLWMCSILPPEVSVSSAQWCSLLGLGSRKQE